ncbi:hypothetical protein Tco_0080380 [Tanacetum coccineum]
MCIMKNIALSSSIMNSLFLALEKASQAEFCPALILALISSKFLMRASFVAFSSAILFLSSSASHSFLNFPSHFFMDSQAVLNFFTA